VLAGHDYSLKFPGVVMAARNFAAAESVPAGEKPGLSKF